MSPPTARVLVVDDDPNLREVLRYTLAREGFDVLEAQNGRAALDLLARAEAVDLVVLDVLMPELDGLATCRELRRSSAVPVVFLSSRGEELDRVLGLELGGDDYITKPFSPRELVSRVRAVLRRTRPAEPAAPTGAVLRHGAMALDLEAHRCHVSGEEVVLTLTEFGILRTLMDRPGRACSRDVLIEMAYPDRRFVSGRTVDSHVRRIRQKLGALGVDPVETVHGLGYRLRTPAPA